MTPTLERRISDHCRPRGRTSRPAQILCVDDDPDIQTTVELRMRAFDVEINHAFYGTQGYYEAIKCRPDLILMDLAMPNGSGEYLLDGVRQNATTAGIPVIVLTGMRDPALKQRILSAGADVYLQKPAQFDDLLHQIGRFIDLRRIDSDKESRC